MFDKKIIIWVNRCPIALTNKEVRDLFLEKADINVMRRRFEDTQSRLALANEKLKEYGHNSGF